MTLIHKTGTGNFRLEAAALEILMRLQKSCEFGHDWTYNRNPGVSLHWSER